MENMDHQTQNMKFNYIGTWCRGILIKEMLLLLKNKHKNNYAQLTYFITWANLTWRIQKGENGDVWKSPYYTYMHVSKRKERFFWGGDLHI